MHTASRFSTRVLSACALRAHPSQMLSLHLYTSGFSPRLRCTAQYERLSFGELFFMHSRVGSPCSHSIIVHNPSFTAPRTSSWWSCSLSLFCLCFAPSSKSSRQIRFEGPQPQRDAQTTPRLSHGVLYQCSTTGLKNRPRTAKQNKNTVKRNISADLGSPVKVRQPSLDFMAPARTGHFPLDTTSQPFAPSFTMNQVASVTPTSFLRSIMRRSLVIMFKARFIPSDVLSKISFPRACSASHWSEAKLKDRWRLR